MGAGAQGQPYLPLCLCSGGEDMTSDCGPSRAETLGTVYLHPAYPYVLVPLIQNLWTWECEISLLEISFKPWWEYSFLGKLMVQIRLLEAHLDHLENVLRELAYLYPPIDIALYVSLIDQSKPNSNSASLASQATLCAAFLHAVWKYSVQNNVVFFSFLYTTSFIQVKKNLFSVFVV